MEDISEEQEFKYGEHSLQKIKVFKYSSTNASTYIYIHGGAWRDPSNTFDEMRPVLGIPNANLIGINYRLSPEIKHPEHLIDILRASRFVKQNFDVSQITLLGHSVGATMILQLLHYRQIIRDGLKHTHKDDLSSLDNLFAYVNDNVLLLQVIFLDGIYDVVELLKEYPDYASFVDDAFVSNKHFADSTQLSSANESLDLPFSLVSKDTKFLIYQSLEDDLLSMKQTHLLIDYLSSKNQGFTLHVGNWGKHEEIFSKYREIVFSGNVP